MNSAFSWTRGLGYGALIWLIMFALTSALVGFEAMDTAWGQALTIGVSAILAFVFAFGTKPSGTLGALGYGGLWVAIGILLDFAVTYQFNDTIFGSWQYWLNYALVLIAPVAWLVLHPRLPRHSMA